MDREKAVEIARKLLALAQNNSNEHESNGAQTKFEELSAMYNITMADLIQSEDTTRGVGEITVKGMSKRKGSHGIYEAHDWEGLLLNLSKAFHTRCVMSRRYEGWTVTFYGLDQDMELAVWFYKRLRRDIMSVAQYEYKLANDQRDFAAGMACIICNRLEEMYRRFKEQADVTTMALIVRKEGAIDDYVKLNHPSLREGKLARIGNYEAFGKGKEKGEKIGLGRPISRQGDLTAKPMLT